MTKVKRSVNGEDKERALIQFPLRARFNALLLRSGHKYGRDNLLKYHLAGCLVDDAPARVEPAATSGTFKHQAKDSFTELAPADGMEVEAAAVSVRTRVQLLVDLLQERERLNTMDPEDFDALLAQSRVVDKLHVEYERARRDDPWTRDCRRGPGGTKRPL